MKINTNRWNKFRYSLYAPGYDIAARILDHSRKYAIESLHIKPNDKILIIGAGTGLDLEHLPVGCDIVATDITPAMIAKVKKRNALYKHKLNTMVMDGQNLDFENHTFDIIILHLIISVIPDPFACIKETERLLKMGGQISVFDKFVRKNQQVSFTRRFFNVFTNLFFSDITRSFEDILKQTQLSLVSDVDANFNGNFRLIKLQKK